MSKRHLLVALSLVAGLAQSADAVVIDFESLRPDPPNGFPGTVGNHTFPYVEDGFVLTQSSGPPAEFQSFHEGAPEFRGSVHFFHNRADAILSVTAVDGGAFSFQSIALNSFIENAPSVTEFVGRATDGSLITRLVRIDALPPFETASFGSAFQQVTEMHWRQGNRETTGSSPFGAFYLDNIVVGPPIPEPDTVALMAIGLAWLGWAGRKRIFLPRH